MWVLQSEENKMPVVLRLTRHPADEARINFLKEVFGNHVEVITEDIPYGNDPVAEVQTLIGRLCTDDKPVIAIEAIAPFPVLMTLVGARRQLGVPLIRVQFARDESGRAIVAGKDHEGRDILTFSHYEELLRIEFETQKLQP